jgi:hypothetical protein
MSENGFTHYKKGTFGKSPIELLTDHEINDGAVRLYAYMHWRFGSNGRNFEGRESMAKAMGVSQGTITNRIAILEKHNWLVVVNRKGKSNFYHVFECQVDCVQWRKDHNEPKPKRKAQNRKTRKGKGGRPKTKVVNPSLAVPQNSGLAVPQNLSFSYLDSGNLDSNNIPEQAQEGVPQEPEPKPAVPRSEITKLTDVPKTERAALFYALSEHLFQTGDKVAFKAKPDAVKKKVIQQINRLVIMAYASGWEAETVSLFVEWYFKQNGPATHLPTSQDNFAKWIMKYAESAKGKPEQEPIQSEDDFYKSQMGE